MKHVNWTKLNDAKLLQNPRNVWTKLTGQVVAGIDYAEIEVLFSASSTGTEGRGAPQATATPKVR